MLQLNADNYHKDWIAICSRNFQPQKNQMMSILMEKLSVAFALSAKATDSIHKKSIHHVYQAFHLNSISGRIGQSVTCLTADPGVSSLILAKSHTFAEIDHEIISTAIPLLHPDSGRVVVTYKRKYVQEVLVNCFNSQACPWKSVVRWPSQHDDSCWLGSKASNQTNRTNYIKSMAQKISQKCTKGPWFKMQFGFRFKNILESQMMHRYFLRGLRKEFLTHRMRISEILPWDRKTYLSHGILPRLSREGSVTLLFWNSCTWSSSDVIVMLSHVIMWNCILAYSGTSGSLF